MAYSSRFTETVLKSEKKSDQYMSNFTKSVFNNTFNSTVDVDINAINRQKASQDNFPTISLNENKSILKTISAGAQHLGQGALKGLEGVFVDTPLIMASGVKKLFGDEEGAKTLMEASDVSLADMLINYVSGNETNPYINGNQNLWNREVDKNSYIKQDNFGGKVISGIGEMLPTIAIGGGVKGTNLTKKAASNVLLGSKAFSGATNEAYRDSGDIGKSMLYGLGSAGVELATEQISGGIPGLKQINGNTKKEILKNYAKSAIGEGVEEVTSSLVNPLLQTTYKGSEALNRYKDKDYWKDVLESGLVGTTIGGVLDSPNTIHSIRNNRNLNNKSTGINDLRVNDTNTPVEQNTFENGLKGDEILHNQDNIKNSLYQFEQTNNQKINKFRESAVKYNFNNTSESHNMFNTIEKIMQDKDYNVIFDDTIKTKSGNPVNAQIRNENGEIEIRINPNSNRAGEFLLTHEITHAIETDSMKQLVMDYASKNSEFNQSLEGLKQVYGTNEVSDEVLADISGQLFGNQEFINNLSLKEPNIFKRFYNKIVELANKITGNSKESLFIKDLKNKWETAYRNTTNEQAINNLKNDTKSSKGKLISGEDVIVSDDINGTHPSKQIAEQNLKSMLGIKYLNSSNNTEISIENKDIKKYLNDGYNNQKNTRLKKRISGNYGEILEIAKIDTSKSKQNYKGTNRGKQGFDYYNATLAYPIKNVLGEIIDYKYYEARLVVRKDNNNNFAYDLDNFKEKKGIVLDKTSLSIMADKSAHDSFTEDNISQSNENVNSNTSSTKYSMQNNENNTQGQYAKVNDTKYSQQNDKWQPFLEKNFKATGTRTNMNSIRKGDMILANSDTKNNIEKESPLAPRAIPKDPTKESSYDFKKTKTRKQVQAELLQDMGITLEDISVGKDIASVDMSRTDPIRLNEKVFGYKVGQKINDATINKTKHNESKKIRWLNNERKDIESLGIKPRSKESEAVQKYGEKQYVTKNNEVIPYGDYELAIDFPDVKVQEKIKNAAKVIRNKYDTYIDNINSIITEMGYNPINKRKDYMRHFEALSDLFSKYGLPLNRQSMMNDALPTDINGLTDQFKPGKNFFTSAMERVGMKTSYDAISGIDGYLEGAGDLIYHTEDIQRYRALSKFIRDTYGSQHGFDDYSSMTSQEQAQRYEDIRFNKLSKYAAWLDEQANTLAGKKGKIDRGVEETFGRKIYTICETAKKQVGSNMTGFNVRSALTNFASAIQGASKTNKIAFIKGTISSVNNIIHNDDLVNKSDFLTSRFGSKNLSQKLWQKVSNAGQIFMEGSDYFTANQIWRSKYFENLSKGMTENQAIKNADDFSARIMGDRSKGATAALFNSKTAGFLTQFQLEVNNQWSSLIHDNKIDIQSGNKTGATVVFQLGQLAAMSYLFNNFMKSVTGSAVMIDPIDLLKKIFNPDDDDKDFGERATEVLGDVLDDMPFASIFNGGRIPVGEAFKGGTTLFKTVTNQTDSYGNKYKWSNVKDDIIESSFYWLLPTGYGQIRKSIKGAQMYSGKLPTAGSYTKSGNLRFSADESTKGKIKAMLFGQYSSKEAQKYVESGYKTISKNKIQEMKDLNMTSSEYRNYKKGLSNAGTSIDSKLNYINKQNYSVSQKNIMANNIVNSENIKIDMKDYNDYSSYDEYKYAMTSKSKYNVLKNSKFDYSKYQEIKKEISNIKEKSSNKKTDVFKYINKLPYSKGQKIILFKMAGGYDVKVHKNELYNYINGLKLSKREKEEMWKEIYGG